MFGPTEAGTPPEYDLEELEACLQCWFPSPAFVKVAPIGAYPILPEESAIVARAVPRRQEEFATGRWLSRQGLRSLGFPDAPIGVGRLRNPVWPPAVTGTISHDGDLCAVALIHRSGTPAGIGLDLVHLPGRNGRIEQLASVFVASAGELAAVAAFRLPVEPALLLFSLKESIVKAVSAYVGDFIDLRSIEIHRGPIPTLGGIRLDAEMHAAATPGYLVSAVTLHRAP